MGALSALIGLRLVSGGKVVPTGPPTGTGEADFSNQDNSGLVAALGI